MHVAPPQQQIQAMHSENFSNRQSQLYNALISAEVEMLTDRDADRDLNPVDRRRQSRVGTPGDISHQNGSSIAAV